MGGLIVLLLFQNLLSFGNAVDTDSKNGEYQAALLKIIESQSNLMEEQSKVIENLSNFMEEQSKIIENQSNSMVEQSKIIEKQSNFMDKQSALIEELSELTQDLKATVDATQLTNARQDDQLKILTNNISETHDIERNKRILMLNNPSVTRQPTVAFTARLSQHMTGIGYQQTIVFDNVVSNFGNAYSPVVGVFSAPNNGVYFFFASILSLKTEYVETEIVKNGSPIASTYSYDTIHEQGCNGAVVSLQEGDKVWVRQRKEHGQNVFGNNWSSFSGFQIG